MSRKICHEMIKPFGSEGDVVTWLKKVRLVAKLQNIADLANLIRLYLKDDVFALYLEMNECEQTDVKRIEDRLKEAFREDVLCLTTNYPGSPGLDRQ